MNKIHFKNPVLLLITAIIWGIAFVAQSVGMDPLIITRKGTMIGGFLYATKSKCNRRFGWKQNRSYS